MRRWLFTIAALLAYVSSCFLASLPASAQQFYVVPQFVSNVFATLGIGGGGLLVRQDINPTDGTKIAGADTPYGCFKYQGGGAWAQIALQAVWPAAYWGYQPLTGNSQVGQDPAGCFEVSSAPTNSQVIYIAFGIGGGTAGEVFVSTNGGGSFAATNFNSACGASCTMNPNDTQRTNGRKFAISNASADVAFIGTQTKGVFATTNGTQASPSWGSVSGIPSVSVGGGYNIAFDPSDATGNTAYVCASSHGVYKSTNAASGASSTWALTTGGPTSCQHLIAAASTGIILATDGTAGANGFYWVLNGSTWTKDPQSQGAHFHSVAADLANCATWAACHVALGDNGGGVDFSQNAGAGSPTWNYANITARTCAGAGQPAWQCIANQFFMTNGDMQFEITGGILDFDGGQGFWTTTPPTSGTTVTWAAQVIGVEQVVSTQVVAWNGTPVVGAEDLGVFALNIGTYPTMAGNVNNGPSLTAGWAIDYASSNINFLADINGPEGNGSFDYSGSSTDGGKTFTPYNTAEVDVPATSFQPCAISTTRICATVSSVSGFTSWSNGSGSIVTVLPQNQLNNIGLGSLNGNNYPVTVNPAGECTAPCMLFQNSTWASAISTTGGQYLVYATTRAFSNFNAAYVIQNVTGSGGLVQITWTSNAGLNNGDPVCIPSGTQQGIAPVVMSGATVVSGCWLIESVNNGAQTGTLFGSTFAGGDSYVSGGQMLTTPPNGGAIAASAPTNIVQYRSNNSYPYCSTDGKTFNELALPGAPTYGLITGISGNGTDVTFTTAAAVNVPILTNFNQFTVAGANPSAYNGTYTAISGTSGNTVVAASATVTPYVSGGVLAPVRTGSAIAFSTPAQTVVADRVTSNLFYLYNYDAGIYQIQNCGAPVLVNNGSLTNNALASQKFGVFSNGGTRMKSVPSEAGHFVYSIGGQGAAGAASHPFGQGMWRSCNGGFLMQQFPDLFEVIALGFGPPASGKTYPSEYIVGWYSASNTVATGVFGVYRSIDDPNNGVAPTATYNASISGTALTINSLTSGTVSTGDTVYGVGVTTGTTISSGSGSSWVVNNSQTVASESMVSNGSCTVNTQTWQQLTTPYGQGGNTQTWPIGWMSGKSDITGVLGQYGLIYLGNNAGFVYGYFPYLLNRDLDPSSNDNSPAFLSRAA